MSACEYLALQGHSPQWQPASGLLTDLPTSTADVAEWIWESRVLWGDLSADTRGKTQVNKQKALNTHVHTQYNTHLSPGVHGFVPPVADPSPATDTGVPLLVFGVGGGEVNGVAPSLQIPTPQSLKQGRNTEKQKGRPKQNNNRTLTPFSVGSPSKFSSTYQSPSHSQLPEGSRKLSRGWCCRPVTSLHCQRSLGNKRSEKPSTGFHRWQRDRQTAC